jgi:hypothetical protein
MVLGAECELGERRWSGVEWTRVTADKLARAFARAGEEGRLAALRCFPGLGAHLDETGKAVLWDEGRRYPALALVGQALDALVGADGVKHLAWAAEQEPFKG